MKKCMNFLYLICVLGILLSLAVATVLTPKEENSFWENRTLAEAPVRDPATFMDGSYFSDLEIYLSDHAFGREAMTVLDTRLGLLVHRPVVNDIVVASDVLLPFLDYEMVDENVMKARAEALCDNLKTVSQAASTYGGQYWYVAVPGQYSYLEDHYPEYLNNRETYMDTMVPVLSETLKDSGISFLDLGSMFEALGCPAEYSSAVDNHYSAQGAYVCYDAIINKLNETALTPLPVASVTFSPVDAPYLGARARKLCGLVSIEESLYTMAPTEPVSFTRQDNGQTVDAAVYNSETQRGYITYNYFMGGDNGLTQIDTNRPELPTVLIYGDSYTNALESILYLSCDTMWSIDLRHYTETTLTEFIETHQPDYVICLRDYGVLLDTDGNGGI